MACARAPLLLGLAACLLSGACGGGDAPPGGPAGSTRPWGRGRKEYVALDLPYARHVRADTRGERRLVLNLLPFGAVKVRGHVWPIVTGTEEERTASLEALRRALDEAASGADGDPVPLMLHMDRCANWSWVEQVLRLAVERRSGLARLQWAVRAQGSGRIARQEAAVVTNGAPSVDRLPVLVTGVAAEAREPETRLSIGDWSTITTARCDDWMEGPEARLNRLEVWQDASAVLRERAASYEGVELAFDGDPREVEWRHVVRLFDLLLGAGRREVDLPGLGVRLVLAEPEDPSIIAFRYPDDSVASPLAVILAIVAAVLAFALTFAGAARSRRVRPRRSRSS